jgi:hypothetical protein
MHFKYYPFLHNLLKYTSTFGPSNTWTFTQWPLYTLAHIYICTPTNLISCSHSVSYTATVADLPSVSSCYTGTSLTASTLTSQSTTTCVSTSQFCQVNDI